MSLSFHYNPYNKTSLIKDSEVGICYHIIWPMYDLHVTHGSAFVEQNNIWAKDYWSWHSLRRIC